MTPTTVKGTPSMRTVRARGSAAPNRSVASTSPMKQTRRLSDRSSGSRNRPAAAIVLRIRSNSGLTPRTVFRNSFRSYRMRRLATNSGLRSSIPGTLPGIDSACSGVTRTGLPLRKPR